MADLRNKNRIREIWNSSLPLRVSSILFWPYQRRKAFFCVLPQHRESSVSACIRSCEYLREQADRSLRSFLGCRGRRRRRRRRSFCFALVRIGRRNVSELRGYGEQGNLCIDLVGLALRLRSKIRVRVRARVRVRVRVRRQWRLERARQDRPWPESGRLGLGFLWD
jgi:hypothetical protein